MFEGLKTRQEDRYIKESTDRIVDSRRRNPTPLQEGVALYQFALLDATSSLRELHWLRRSIAKRVVNMLTDQTHPLREDIHPSVRAYRFASAEQIAQVSREDNSRGRALRARDYRNTAGRSHNNLI